MAKYMLATGFPGTILDPISWKRPVPPETNWENPKKPANNEYTTVKTKEINRMTGWESISMLLEFRQLWAESLTNERPPRHATVASVVGSCMSKVMLADIRSADGSLLLPMAIAKAPPNTIKNQYLGTWRYPDLCI